MTQLLYLEDTYLLECSAILEMVSGDDRGTYCILNQTIFYPQGGGQASDIGIIQIGNIEISVTFVSYVDGKARHYGEFESLKGKIGETITLKVNRQNRITNARSHTAGHLIQCVIEEIDPGLRAVKGFHFPVGSHVEFEGDATLGNHELSEKANQKIAELIADNVNTDTMMMTKKEILKACPDLPYALPEDKPLRVMAIGDYSPVPCGGTHIKSLKELGKVEITKMKKKKDRTKVSYTIT